MQRRALVQGQSPGASANRSADLTFRRQGVAAKAPDIYEDDSSENGDGSDGARTRLPLVSVAFFALLFVKRDSESAVPAARVASSRVHVKALKSVFASRRSSVSARRALCSLIGQLLSIGRLNIVC